MCKRGFKECYNEFDLYDAVEHAMCEQCKNKPFCGMSAEFDDDEEEICIHIGQMVQCIYNHFNERKFE